MQTIAITGMSGVIGENLLSFLPQNAHIVDLFHNHPFISDDKRVSHVQLDLRDAQSVYACVSVLRPTSMIHLAAITHIDSCEKDRKRGTGGDVWKVNVEATQSLARVARDQGSHMIFISSECVFGGKKEWYDEASEKKPRSWYGITKNKAEREVIHTSPVSAIIRSVVAYNEHDQSKTIFGILRGKLSQRKKFSVVSDQMLTPTHTDDICRAIGIVLRENLTGTFHVAPEERISPYEMAVSLAGKYNFDQSLVTPISMLEYFGKDRSALRLQSSCLRSKYSQKILGFKARDFSTTLKDTL